MHAQFTVLTSRTRESNNSALIHRSPRIEITTRIETVTRIETIARIRRTPNNDRSLISIDSNRSIAAR